MFGSTALEVAIGLILFFLLASLLCAAIREAIETLMKSRARDLERGLRNLLDDKDGTGLTSQVLNHGLVSSLFLGDYDPKKLNDFWFREGKHLPPWYRTNVPSYIPSRQFATALLDIVTHEKRTKKDDAQAVVNPLDHLREGAGKIQNERVKSAVLAAIDSAGNDIAKVRDELESWFNASMERVSGWYKQRTQMILFWIGLSAAAILNLDALTVASRLATDPSLRALAVAQAQEVVDDEKLRNRLAPPAAAPADAPPDNETAVEDALNKAAENTKKDVERAQKIIGQVGYPIGWIRPDSGFPVPGPQFCGKFNKDGLCELSTHTPMGIFQLLIGWLITAIAVTLGAPFWFDLLNRFMTIRSTTKPKKEEGGKP
jgi:hypothetical protein